MTNTITLPHPFDYDEAKAAGWTCHRNGVGGRSFWAIVQDGQLHIALYVPDREQEVYADQDPLPLAFFTSLADMPVVSTHQVHGFNRPFTFGFVAEASDGDTTFTVLDDEDGERLVLLVRPSEEPDETVECAFNLRELLAGSVRNTYRGDRIHYWADEIREQRNEN